MKNLFGKLIFACFAFFALSAEECGKTHYIDDSGFDLWCGDTLCNWDVASGNVARAATWHKDDYAVELIGNDVLITQLSTRTSTNCLRFEVLADIDDDARLTLSIDYFDDGVVDYEQELGHVRWESLVHFVATPNTWQGVRFSLHKEGPGRARLAQIEATSDSNCIDKPIELPAKPLGAYCINGGECASMTCASSAISSGFFSTVCSECATNADCAEGFVCGSSAESRPFMLPPRACVAEASRALGSVCASEDECTTGVCCEGMCSECCSADECGGDACQAASVPYAVSALAPRLCDGGATGALCLSDTDCVSAACTGSGNLFACQADGRDCSFHSDCPGGSAASPSQCLAIGIVAGSCQ